MAPTVTEAFREGQGRSSEIKNTRLVPGNYACIASQLGGRADAGAVETSLQRFGGVNKKLEWINKLLKGHNI